MKSPNYIVRHVRNAQNQLIGTLVARMRNDKTVLVTASVCHDTDRFSRKAGILTALKQKEFHLSNLHKSHPSFDKIETIKLWIPRFVEEASNYFNDVVKNPLI